MVPLWQITVAALAFMVLVWAGAYVLVLISCISNVRAGAKG